MWLLVRVLCLALLAVRADAACSKKCSVYQYMESYDGGALGTQYACYECNLQADTKMIFDNTQMQCYSGTEDTNYCSSCDSNQNHCCMQPNNCVCKPGYWLNEFPGQNRKWQCVTCAAGTEKPKALNQATCAKCDFSNDMWAEEGSASCTKCEVGKFAALDANPTIIHLNSVKSGACWQCNAGFAWQDRTCTACPKGTAAGQGQTQCSLCAGDTYAPVAQSPTCLPCKREDGYRAFPAAVKYACCAWNQYFDEAKETCKPWTIATLYVSGEQILVRDTDSGDVSIQAAQYVKINQAGPMSDWSITVANCDGNCPKYSSRQGCGQVYSSMQPAAVLNLVVYVRGTKQSIQRHLESGVSRDEIVNGVLIREGMCQECIPCDVGYYMRYCGKFDPGTCFMCRDRCSAKGYFMSHDHPNGCVNQYLDRITGGVLVRDTVYVSESDYNCQECQRWRKTDDGAFQLLVGCAGDERFKRWDPRAQTVEGMLQTVECHFREDGRAELTEACHYRNVTLYMMPQGGFPAGDDLVRQNFTSWIPYCPPGWLVLGTLLERQLTSTAFDPAFCKRCTYCDYTNGSKVRAASWQRCPGHGIVDTQTCADGCGIGEYIKDGACRLCKTCGD